MVKCEFCGRLFKQLSNSHLKKCVNITQKEYKVLFPNNEITSKETKKKSSEIRKGVKQSEEWIRKRLQNSSGHKGHHHSQETRELIREKTKKAMDKPEVRERMSKSIKEAMNRPEVKEKMKKPKSENHKQNLKNSFTRERRELHSFIQREHFQDKDFIKKFVEGSKVSPNKTELVLIQLLNQLNLKYKYVGDYKLWIGGKNPDFIDENTKKIIEFFGYRHRKECTQKSNKHHENDRIKHYQKYGYKCLVLWDEDLVSKESLRQKILSF